MFSLSLPPSPSFPPSPSSRWLSWGTRSGLCVWQGRTQRHSNDSIPREGKRRVRGTPSSTRPAEEIVKERRIEKEACRRELKHPALNQLCYSISTTEEEMRPELCVCSCLPQEGERQMQNKGTIIPSGRWGRQEGDVGGSKKKKGGDARGTKNGNNKHIIEMGIMKWGHTCIIGGEGWVYIYCL